MNQTTPHQRIVVHGATGTQGRPLVERLVADGHTVVSISRNPDRLPDLSTGAHEHVVANLDDADSLVAAYADADAVVVQLPLVFDDSAVTQAESVLDALGRAGVGRVVFNAGGPLVPEPIGVPYVDARAILAQRIHQVAPVAAVIGPAGAYMENLSAPGLAARIAQGQLAYPLPIEAPMPWVALADVADVIARSLVAETPAAFEIIAGPENLTGDQSAAAVSRALGRPIEWLTITPAEFGEIITDQIGPAAAAGIAGFYAAASDGPPPAVDPSLVVTGSTTLEEWARTALSGR